MERQIIRRTKEKPNMTTHKLMPVGDRVLVEPVDELRADSPIVIPENVKEPSQQGIVRALGKGKHPWEVKQGDRVLFSKYSGTIIKSEETDYKLIPRDDLLAVIESSE